MFEVSRPILVTGATGAQGGAVASALLAGGHAVRIFVRDPQSRAARDFVAQGAEAIQGDFDDAQSLAAAMHGVAGVFSVQLPPAPEDLEREIRTGQKLIDAAKAANVEVFVHTSVARTGDQTNFTGWHEDRWWKNYWDSKSAVNDAVRGAGFENFVILKPAFMMDNFAQPKAGFMFPALAAGVIATALKPETRLDLIAAADIGAFAAAAFTDPGRFSGVVIDLAAESLTMTEVAALLSHVTGRPVRAEFLKPEAAIASGINAGVVSNHEWDNVEGYRVNIAALAAWGIRLTSFAEWAEAHQRAIQLN